MLDEINDVEQDYDKLEIRDKNFYAKRRKKIALIVTPYFISFNCSYYYFNNFI